MNVSYTGKTRDLTPAEQEKLDGKFLRIAKLVDRKGERKAHVVVTTTRHLQKAEIRMQFEEHPLVGVASDPDFYQAVSTAVDKLEKQTLKVREKMRDHRGAEVKIAARLDPMPDSTAAPKKTRNGASNGLAADGSASSPDTMFTVRSAKIHRAANHLHSKPMTLDEALIKIKRHHGYFAFINIGTDKLNVLIRRPDGHFDLVEG